LIRCFGSVFPSLTEDEIRAASDDATGSWDSLTSVTLAAVIQEEFSMEIAPEDLPELHSFAAFRSFVHRINPAGE
jgi:acyl carrier protein